MERVSCDPMVEDADHEDEEEEEEETHKFLLVDSFSHGRKITAALKKVKLSVLFDVFLFFC